MIPGFDDSDLGSGAPLGDLASARHPLLSRLSGHWAAAIPAHVAGCARALLDRGHAPRTPARVLIVPGRIEVLGKHTDYAGGRSLLAALELLMPAAGGRSPRRAMSAPGPIPGKSRARRRATVMG